MPRWQDPSIDQLIQTMEAERRSSPSPGAWGRFYQFLSSKRRPDSSPPPVPLILAASAESPASKHARLTSQLRWAEENHCSDEALRFLRDIPDEEWEVSSALEWYTDGYDYHPSWNYSARPTPDATALATALNVLRPRWLEIAGPDVGHITEPVGFTGAKSRRLLVRAVVGTKPPWGSWTGFSPDASRSSFTRLRASINGAIKPLEVDHVDFIEEVDSASSEAPRLTTRDENAP